MKIGNFYQILVYYLCFFLIIDQRIILKSKMQKKITGLITDKQMLNHKSKRKHPERPQRLSSILAYLTDSLYTKHPSVQYIGSIDRAATAKQLQLVHKPKYIKHIKNLWPTTSHRSDIMVLDTYFNEHSEKCAKMAVGGVLEAVDHIVEGNWKTGFALVRPPGHHSGARNTINGFCVFNNVAIAARYLQQTHKKTRIAIVDWDVHHGDGTQHIFQNDGNILMISIHRYDRGTFYPASEEGHFSNVGSGWGLGSKINVSLDHVDQKFKQYEFQAPGDNQYIYIYHRIVEPVLKQFDPEFILVSSGFDAARGDPLGGFTITPNGYYYMTKKLVQLNKPLLVALEGGYNLNSISKSAGAVMKGLLREQGLPEKCDIVQKLLKDKCQLNEKVHQQIDEIVSLLSKHWKCLQHKELKTYTEMIKQNKDRLFGIVSADDESSSSSESEKQDSQTQETQLPQFSKEQQTEVTLQKQQSTKVKKDKKKKMSKKESENFQKQEENEVEGTSQFYFAAGHLQRFKNFSPKNQKISKLTHEEEIDFYEKMGLQRNFTPKYYGREDNYIIIENLLYEQIDPVVIDIKMSRQSCNDALSQERRQKEKKKQEKSTSEKYAFRISGYTTPTDKTGGILMQNEDLVKKILQKAVTKQNRDYFCKYLQQLSITLKSINRKYYGTSIVMIKGPNKSEIRWIDFHYWQETTDGSIDENMIEGVNNLKKFIQETQVEQK